MCLCVFCVCVCCVYSVCVCVCVCVEVTVPTLVLHLRTFSGIQESDDFAACQATSHPSSQPPYISMPQVLFLSLGCLYLFSSLFCTSVIKLYSLICNVLVHNREEHS